MMATVMRWRRVGGNSGDDAYWFFEGEQNEEYLRRDGNGRGLNGLWF